MTTDLLKKARANRLAAIARIAERKTNLVNLIDFRSAVERREAAPDFCFVSSRSAILADDLAA
jgi:hypothetical protein